MFVHAPQFTSPRQLNLVGVLDQLNNRLSTQSPPQAVQAPTSILSFVTSTPESTITNANARTVLYPILEKQFALAEACPEQLQESEWIDFKEELSTLVIDSDVPETLRSHLQVYFGRFLAFLNDPPMLDDGSQEDIDFECGFVQGELMTALGVLLLDLEITPERASEDAGDVLADSIRSLYEILTISYWTVNPFNPQNLSGASEEEILFLEYLFIWRSLIGQEEVTPAVAAAQLTLQGIEPSSITGDLQTDFVQLYAALREQSRALTNGDFGSGEVRARASLQNFQLIYPRLNLSLEQACTVADEDFCNLLIAVAGSSTP